MTTLYSALSLLFLALALLTAVLTVVGKIRFYGGLTATTLTVIISNMWSILRANLILGKNAINHVMDITFDAVGDALMELPLFSELIGQLAEDRAEVQQLLELFLEQMKAVYLALFPMMLILFALVISYLLCMLIKLLGYSWRKKESAMPPFSQMRIRRMTVLMLGISFLLVYVLPLQAGVVAINVFGVLLFITIFSGFSMVDFWLKRRISNGVLRFILYALVLGITYSFSGFFTLMLTGIGILDAFFDYRTRVVS